MNSYPELPSVPYHSTRVAMTSVIQYMIDSSAKTEVKRAAYILFRVESANGSSGVNNNYIGMQADSGRWPDELERYFSGVVTEQENQTGRVRLFLTFAHWEDCVDCLLDRIAARGLYIGGTAEPISDLLITDPAQLVRAYVKEWAKGERDAEPDVETIEAWCSMYDQAIDLFI